MGRCGFSGLVVLVLMAICLAGCGSSGSGVGTPVPATVLISPSSGTIDLGATLSFTASALDSARRPVLVTISFHSSNTAVLTVANNGLACAGSWDSLAIPVVCTPGPAGVAQVTAVANGVSSPPVTVYVHQHIEKITVTATPPPTTSCFSQTQIQNYTAAAYNTHGDDISATVGPFNWQEIQLSQTSVVTLSTTASGLLFNQAQATADVPGLTQIFATASNVSSIPMTFVTCPVQSISLQVTGSPDNTIVLSKGGTQTVTATVLDSLGATLTNPPLTWTSSNAFSVSASSSTSTPGTGTVSGSQPGGATVIASCTPPTCNVGFYPSAPIYPTNPGPPTSAVSVTVTGASSTTTATVYAVLTGCDTPSGCTGLIPPTNSIVPINTKDNSVGNPAALPNTPNSLVFNSQGNKAYLGSSSGLMVFDPTAAGTVSTFSTVTGQVLAVSPNGNKVVISDRQATPNRVFIFDSTSPNNPTTLAIAGATAAEFSPDSLKAFILAGSKLYVYSLFDALQSVSLSSPANDVAFFSNGGFAYLAGGSPNQVTVRTTCDASLAGALPTPVNPAFVTPIFIRPVPDGIHMLALDSTGIDVITVAGTDPPPAPSVCPPTISHNAQDPIHSVSLGQGTFTPLQFIVAPDGTKAYVVASDRNSILVFNLGGETTSAIPLAGGAYPLSASLTPDGTLLYIAASDGLVHALDTVAGGDIAQVSFLTNLCSSTSVTCVAGLVAARP